MPPRLAPTSSVHPALGLRDGVVAVVLCALCLPVLSWPARLVAQARPASGSELRTDERRLGSVPHEVAQEAVALWNSPRTRRVRGEVSIAVGDTVRGDLAVLEGRARINGVVLGQLFAINSDVSVAGDARVGGTLTIVGGTLTAPASASVGGDVRIWSARLKYRESGDTLTADAERELFTRLSRWKPTNDGTHSELFLTSAHTYNRVEGLPIYIGPRLRAVSGKTRAIVELFGVVRTGERLEWTPANRGHRALLEVQRGERAGVKVGGRLFDVIDPMEQWQLTEREIGLATFLAARDYRDYWQRHGASAHVALFAGRGNELRAEYGEERWTSRTARGVWSLTDDKPWRANPASDEGVLHLATVTATIDTRNNAATPNSGWLLFAQMERGSGRLSRIAPTTPGVRDATIGEVEYSRGLLDLRRYNRLAPGAQLNLRAVLGGWVGGDALPLQRRVSVSGIDALPGFDFRRSLDAADVGTCATGDNAAYVQLGRPAQCERMLLVQAEWRGDFRIRLFGDRDWFGDRRRATSHYSADGAWVVFANSGRGWLLHGTDPTLRFGLSDVPEIGTWRTDLGGGFDFGDFGVYVAQAVSKGGLKPNVYVRLGHRF